MREFTIPVYMYMYQFDITSLSLSLFCSPCTSAGTRKNAPSSTVGADGKDAIALRDEVVELKKSLNTVTREKDLIQARYAKLEQALAKKDKEIEDLLASGHITVSCELVVTCAPSARHTCTMRNVLLKSC